MAEAFDPDKFLADTSSGSSGFNPDKFLAETEPAKNNINLLSRRGLLPPSKEDINGTLQLADTLGGSVRTGLASSAGLVLGKGEIVTPQDLIAAQKGQAPSSAEYLKRLGVPEGPSADLPLVGKVSARGAAGFVGDVLTDPLTYATKGLKALSPLGEAAESGGKSIYKSGLKKVDERLAEKGAAPVSDLLLSEGKTGTTKQLAKDTAEIGSKALEDRSALYERAQKAGAKVDMSTALQESEKAVAKMRTDPGLAPTADKLQELIDRYKAAGPTDLATASEWKTNLYNALPESAYDAHGKVKGPAAKVQKAIASDFKNGIVNAGNAAEEGLGDSINALNEKLQTTLTAKRPLAMQVRRAETPNLLTSVDAMLAGSGAIHSPQTGAGLLALKKAADLSKTTYARTKLGKGLIDAGKTGLIDPAARQGLIGYER